MQLILLFCATQGVPHQHHNVSGLGFGGLALGGLGLGGLGSGGLGLGEIVDKDVAHSLDERSCCTSGSVKRFDVPSILFVL